MNDAVNLNLFDQLQSLQSVRLLLIQPHHCLRPPLLAGKTCFACPTVDKSGKLLSTDAFVTVENFCISLLRFTSSKADYRSDWHKMSQDRDGTEWIRTAHIEIYGRWVQMMRAGPRATHLTRASLSLILLFQWLLRSMVLLSDIVLRGRSWSLGLTMS
jgi:hypothetical protein